MHDLAGDVGPGGRSGNGVHDDRGDRTVKSSRSSARGHDLRQHCQECGPRHLITLDAGDREALADQQGGPLVVESIAVQTEGGQGDIPRTLRLQVEERVAALGCEVRRGGSIQLFTGRDDNGAGGNTSYWDWGRVQVECATFRAPLDIGGITPARSPTQFEVRIGPRNPSISCCLAAA